MKALILVLIFVAAVLAGHKGNLAYKKKRIEKKARNMGHDLRFGTEQDKPKPETPDGTDNARL